MSDQNMNYDETPDNPLNSDVFPLEDLVLVSKANPRDVPYIVEGATVWLRSGSPALLVTSVKSGEVMVRWNGQIAKFPVECLTPEPSPN